MDIKPRLSNANKDLIVIAIITVFVLLLSYFFNIFAFLVKLFQDDPKALTFIDEIIMFLLTISVSFAVFSWRRAQELKKETAERIRLQEELIKATNTKAETERIISKQLRSEIELRKELDRKGR